MNENEELISDRVLGAAHQRELIARYCANADERIRTASSKSEAMRIVDDLCEHFDRACESSMVRTFLKRHVAHLLASHWGERV
jgi:hypothetical protein